MAPTAQGNYTRTELCDLAGFDVDRFKTLQRQQRLPFSSIVTGMPEDQSERLEALSRRRYFSDNAFDLMATDSLANKGGLQVINAASIVLNCRDFVQEFWPQIVEGDQPIFIGYASRGPLETSGGEHIGGTLGHIEFILKVRRVRDPHNEEVSRLALFNATDIARRLRHRAGERGYEIPAEFWSPDRFSKNN